MLAQSLCRNSPTTLRLKAHSYGHLRLQVIPYFFGPCLIRDFNKA